MVVHPRQLRRVGSWRLPRPGDRQPSAQRGPGGQCSRGIQNCVLCNQSPSKWVLAWLASAVLGDTCPMILSVLIIAKTVYRNKNLKIQTYFNLPFMHSFQNFISSFMIKKKKKFIFVWLECQDCNVSKMWRNIFAKLSLKKLPNSVSHF